MFPRSVQQYQAPAVEGDFASANPRGTVVAGEGELKSGVGGVTIGRFAWADASGNVTNAGAGVPTGFLHRDQQALITAYLGAASMVIPQGYHVTLFRDGDFWVKSLTIPTKGQKVFASLTTGDVKTAAAGATVTGYIETAWVVETTGLINELIKISRS